MNSVAPMVTGLPIFAAPFMAKAFLDIRLTFAFLGVVTKPHMGLTYVKAMGKAYGVNGVVIPFS